MLRVRPHSSVDLTNQGNDRSTAGRGGNPHPSVPESSASQRLPSGPYLPAQMGMPADPRGDDANYMPHPARPNGYTAGANPQEADNALEGARQWQRQDSSGQTQSMRPLSASSPRFEGHSGGRTHSHDSLTDPGARALLAELHKVRAMGGGEGGRVGQPGFMTPPPPPPPRTPPLPGFDPAQGTIERQGSFQVPYPSDMLHQPSFWYHCSSRSSS